MERTDPSRIRQHLHQLRGERYQLEEQLLEIRALVRGSLVENWTLSGGRRRPEAAFYVSRVEDERRRLAYVRRSTLDKVRALVEAYRRYQRGLRRLRVLSRGILQALGQLRESLDAGVKP